MPKSVRDLVAGLMVPGEAGLPTIQDFPPLDIEKIAAELQLDARAEAAGRAGDPLPQAGGPDTAELDILDYIERLARKAHEVYLSQIDEYEIRIRKSLITPDLRVQIEAAGVNALAELKTQIIQHRNQLNLLLQAWTGRDEDYRQFRERHGLTRLPRIPSPEERTHALVMLVLLVLLHSILSAMFLAEGSETELREGVLPALAFSLLNVGAASWYAMYGFPYRFHHRLSVRAAGIFLALLFVIWLIGLNFAIGHFRELFVAGAGRVPTAGLLHRILSAPFTLNDMMSLLLAVLGIGVGVLSIINVAAIRDRYPGYTAVGQERERALDRYAETNQRSLAALLELRSQVIDDMSSAVKLIHVAQFGMLRTVDARAVAHQTYLAYLNQLAGVHQRLVQRYRERNSRSRPGDHPAYFERPAVRPLLAEPSTLAPLPGLEETAFAEVVALIDAFIKTVNERMEEALPEYQMGERLRSGLN